MSASHFIVVGADGRILRVWNAEKERWERHSRVRHRFKIWSRMIQNFWVVYRRAIFS